MSDTPEQRLELRAAIARAAGVSKHVVWLNPVMRLIDAYVTAELGAIVPEKIDWTKPDNHDSGCETQFIEDDEAVACNCSVKGHNDVVDTILSKAKERGFDLQPPTKEAKG